jgi:hypothetical protein
MVKMMKNMDLWFRAGLPPNFADGNGKTHSFTVPVRGIYSWKSKQNLNAHFSACYTRFKGTIFAGFVGVSL